MPALTDVPDQRIQIQSHQRVIAVREALTSMSLGGTARDIQERVCMQTRDRVSTDTVRRALWLLHDLGVIEVLEIGNARWWKNKACRSQA